MFKVIADFQSFANYRYTRCPHMGRRHTAQHTFEKMSCLVLSQGDALTTDDQQFVKSIDSFLLILKAHLLSLQRMSVFFARRRLVWTFTRLKWPHEPQLGSFSNDTHFFVTITKQHPQKQTQTNKQTKNTTPNNRSRLYSLQQAQNFSFKKLSIFASPMSQQEPEQEQEVQAVFVSTDSVRQKRPLYCTWSHGATPLSKDTQSQCAASGFYKANKTPVHSRSSLRR